MKTDDPEFGSELRKRQMPELARKERRRDIGALIFGVVVGLGLLMDALYARTHGGMVESGARDGFLKIPWWVEAAIAAFFAGASGFALWRVVPDKPQDRL